MLVDVSHKKRMCVRIPKLNGHVLPKVIFVRIRPLYIARFKAVVDDDSKILERLACFK